MCASVRTLRYHLLQWRDLLFYTGRISSPVAGFFVKKFNKSNCLDVELGAFPSQLETLRLIRKLGLVSTTEWTSIFQKHAWSHDCIHRKWPFGELLKLVRSLPQTLSKSLACVQGAIKTKYNFNLKELSFSTSMSSISAAEEVFRQQSTTGIETLSKFALHWIVMCRRDIMGAGAANSLQRAAPHEYFRSEAANQTNKILWRHWKVAGKWPGCRHCLSCFRSFVL